MIHHAKVAAAIVWKEHWTTPVCKSWVLLAGTDHGYTFVRYFCHFQSLLDFMYLFPSSRTTCLFRLGNFGLLSLIVLPLLYLVGLFVWARSGCRLKLFLAISAVAGPSSHPGEFISSSQLHLLIAPAVPEVVSEGTGASKRQRFGMSFYSILIFHSVSISFQNLPPRVHHPNHHRRPLIPGTISRKVKENGRLPWC